MQGLARTYDMVGLDQAPQLGRLVGGVDAVFGVDSHLGHGGGRPGAAGPHPHRRRVRRRLARRAPAQRLRRRLPGQGRRRPAARDRHPALRRRLDRRRAPAGRRRRPPSAPGWPDGRRKTEKATPKKQKEAREKGQVARSTDLQGAVVLMVGIVALGSAGPGLVQRLGDRCAPRSARPARPTSSRCMASAA